MRSHATLYNSSLILYVFLVLLFLSPLLHGEDIDESSIDIYIEAINKHIDELAGGSETLSLSPEWRAQVNIFSNSFSREVLAAFFLFQLNQNNIECVKIHKIEQKNKLEIVLYYENGNMEKYDFDF